MSDQSMMSVDAGAEAPAAVHPAETPRILPAEVEPAEVAPAPAPRAKVRPAGLPMKVSGAVKPSCAGGCGTSAQEGDEMVFAIGELGYDFGFEARRDYFIQQMGDEVNPFNPVKMAEHLDKHQQDCNALIWTLSIEGTPVYAIEPQDQLALATYSQLIKFLVEQEKEGVERVALSGRIVGSTRLFNGQRVPVVAPVLRGLFNWNIQALLDACFGEAPPNEDPKKEEHDKKVEGVRELLERVYYQMRNLGTSPEDRAMNYSATNAFQSKQVFEDAVHEGMVLDTIQVERSTICRPDSDCWDVKYLFFDPTKIHERARKVYRYTVDVSDYVPVTVGKLRTWFAYSS